jgi:lysophospholipase L1-like esterase
MRQAKSFAILLAAFTAGSVVAAWKLGIVRALTAGLGLQNGTYYDTRVALFRQTVGYADVIMLGDSITEGIDWHEVFPNVRILNRGIAGDTTKGVLKRLDEIIARRPKVVFLMIGINDLQAGVPVHIVSANIRSIVGTLEQKQISIVLQKTLYVTTRYRPQVNSKVNELNESLSDLCKSPTVMCLDLNQILGDGGALSPSFSQDGLHLNTAGYLVWKNEITAYLPP